MGPRRGPPGLHQPYHGPQHHRWGALRGGQRCAEDPAGLQVSPGYHCYPRYGRVVPIDQTISGFKAILAGKYDHLPEVAFYMVGNIDEVTAKAERLAAERGD